MKTDWLIGLPGEPRIAESFIEEPIGIEMSASRQRSPSMTECALMTAVDAVRDRRKPELSPSHIRYLFAFCIMLSSHAMNLFSQLETEPTHEEIAPGAVLMRGLALPQDREFLAAVDTITTAAPLHHAKTPTGLPMSVMVTDCGDQQAFSRRWDPNNTEGRRLWPPIPQVLREFAIRCAVRAGFPEFRPDSCHINRYEAGTKLGLHQDRHECDLTQPIVSVSFGLQCVFLFGGLERTEKPRHILLEHGDAFVWGGPSRMCFHGVQPLKPGSHMLTGPYRINLTFRKIA